MKRLIFLSFMMIFAHTLWAKEFHFIYIRYEYPMNKNDLIQQVIDLQQKFDNNTDYVIYYSNESLIMDRTTWEFKKFASSVAESGSFYSIDIPAEIELISNNIEKNLQLEYDIENSKVESKNNTTKCILDCFVGGRFVRSYQNALFARLLIINNLQNSDFDVEMIYYPCNFNYTEETLQFNPLYRLNIHPTIK